MGDNINALCPLCEAEEESVSHLFFDCKVSKQVWKKFLGWQGISRYHMTSEAEVFWAEGHGRGKSSGVEVYRMTLTAAMYYIWRERNQRVFQATKQSTTSIVKQIVQEEA